MRIAPRVHHFNHIVPKWGARTLSVFPGAIDHWQPKHCSSCELGWEELQGLHTSLSRGFTLNHTRMLMSGLVKNDRFLQHPILGQKTHLTNEEV